MKSLKSRKFAMMLSAMLCMATAPAFSGLASDGDPNSGSQPVAGETTPSVENAGGETTGGETTTAEGTTKTETTGGETPAEATATGETTPVAGAEAGTEAGTSAAEAFKRLTEVLGESGKTTGETKPEPFNSGQTPPVQPTPGDETGATPVEDAEDVDPNEKGVEVSKFDTVSLNVQNTDLANVLQLLSIQSKRNIVPSPKVSGTVTANLYDVTFHEALDAILQQNGAGFKEKGNFIFVYTFEELEEIEKAEKKVTHRVIELNYISSSDAATYIQPLISSAGAIVSHTPVGAGMQPTLADGGANSSAHYDRILIRDYPENVDMIANVVKQLDVRPKQVLIESTILKADIHEDLEFGVDMAILSDVGVNEGTSGDPLSAVTEMITGDITKKNTSAITSTPGNVKDGAGALKVGVLTKNVAVFVRALDEVTDTTIVANPKIMTLNKQRAEVLVGEKLGYLSTTATATATTQTVEFLDTGTQLTVRPFISPDGMVRMELRPSISSAETRDVVTGSSVVTIPDEVTQELVTNVMVRDGQTVVLGGLFKEETTIKRNQVPGIGDVPVVGNAFKGRTDDFDRSEVIFLVTPHVIRDEIVGTVGSSVMDTIEMRRIGARDGLLPWSRTKMSSSHLRAALTHINNKEPEQAMWQIDLALDLNPTMVEAIRLKEKLTGQREYLSDGSILGDVVDQVIEAHTGKKANDIRRRPMMPSPRNSKAISDGEKVVFEPAEPVNPLVEVPTEGTELVPETPRTPGTPGTPGTETTPESTAEVTGEPVSDAKKETPEGTEPEAGTENSETQTAATETTEGGEAEESQSASAEKEAGPDDTGAKSAGVETEKED